MQYYLSFIVNYYKGLQIFLRTRINTKKLMLSFWCNTYKPLLEEDSIENEKSFTISDFNL